MTTIAPAKVELIILSLFIIFILAQQILTEFLKKYSSWDRDLPGGKN
jgi:hypothetical protein